MEDEELMLQKICLHTHRTVDGQNANRQREVKGYD